MNSQNLITRDRLAIELGCHPRTLKRKLQKLGYQLPPGLVSAVDAEVIKKLLLQSSGLESFTPKTDQALQGESTPSGLHLEAAQASHETFFSSDETWTEIGT